MDLQSYKVAVHLVLNDDITRNMTRISEDAVKLNARFEQMQKVIKSVTAASNNAAKAIKKMNEAMNGQFNGAIRGAKEYSETIKTITRNANEAARSLQLANRSQSVNLTPYAVGGALMLQAGAGGRGAIPPGNNLSTAVMGDYRGSNGLPNYSGGRGGIPLIGGSRSYNGAFRHIDDADFPPSGGGNNGSGGGNNRGVPAGGGYSHADAMAGAAVGYFGIAFIDKIAERSLDYERDLARLRQMGLSSDQIAIAQKYSDATVVQNTSKLDRLRLFTDAQGSFRESGLSNDKALDAATKMMPIMARYEVASGLLSGSSRAAADYNMKNLNKIVEMMGGLSSTRRASEIVNAVFKAAQSSGRMVNENELKQFVAYGSSATNHQNTRAMFGGLEPIIGETGGSTSAVGLRTAFGRVNGMMSLPPKLLLREMRRLGITDKTGDKQTKRLRELEQTDLIAYTQEIMSVYRKHGIKGADIEHENAILFGTNGSKVFNRIMAQMSTIQESLLAYDKALGADATAGDPSNSRLLAFQRMQKKWEDLQITLGKDGGALDLFIKVLDKLGDSIQKITNIAHQHPLMTKLAVAGVAALSTIGLLGGGIFLFTHSIKSVLKPFSLFNDGISKLSMVGSVAGEMTAFGKAVQFVGGALNVGMAALAGWQIGTYISNNMDQKDKDAVGEKIATILAWFGNKDAQEALDVNHGRGTYVNGKYTPYPEIPSKQQQSIHVEVPVNLNGKEVARIVSSEQAKAASRPQSGTSQYDISMGYPGPGMNSSIYLGGN